MSFKLPIEPDSITNLTEAKNAIELLLNLYIKQQEEIQLLKKEIARLKGQPKRPQFNTSKQKAFGMSLQLNKEDKNWHKGVKLGTLPIDNHVNLPEETICSCGSSDFKSLRTHTKLIQGILFKRNNVSYHGRDKQCLNCGKIFKTQIPDEVKGVSFDPGLKSLISYLKYACRMTHPLLLRMLTGFGIKISTGEISQILLKNGWQLTPAYGQLKEIGFKNSPYLQSDSTGAKRKDRETGKIQNQYVQVVSNKLLSVFAITRHYNIKTLSNLLTRKGRDKPFVSDDGSPNGDGLHCKAKQVCWVHEIRHYQKLFPFFNPHQKLQERILNSWSSFYYLAKQYGRDPTEEKRQEVEFSFDQITSQVTDYDLLDKQLKLTRKKRGRLLTFLDYPFLPIHNNQCEIDLREFVIQRKISGETKSVAGDRSLERHLSIIQTAQKQGLDIFATLHGLLTGQLPPTILTANIS